MSKIAKSERFADAVEECIRRASAGQVILSVGMEAVRIADTIGLPRRVVAERLIDAACEAQIAMELPTAAELGIR
jgi:hypothetical protein